MNFTIKPFWNCKMISNRHIHEAVHRRRIQRFLLREKPSGGLSKEDAPNGILIEHFIRTRVRPLRSCSTGRHSTHAFFCKSDRVPVALRNFPNPINCGPGILHLDGVLKNYSVLNKCADYKFGNSGAPTCTNAAFRWRGRRSGEALWWSTQTVRSPDLERSFLKVLF